MKIGFFGGCFNPPTIAHIALAKKALTYGKLDKVIVVPVGDFYKKRELASAKHRYNMLKIETEELKNIEVSDMEIGIKEKIYAIDAFKLIKEKFSDDDIYFIMGADNFVNIMNWKDGKELINEYKYIVLERENIDLDEYINKKLKAYKDRIIIIKNEEYKGFSSSKFRQNLKQNQNMISSKVMKYIKENNLF